MRYSEMTIYVDRLGAEISEDKLQTAHFSKNGQQGYFHQEISCRKCGGNGGSDAWRYTGWTCYRCGASTKLTKDGRFSDPSSPVKISFYTPEKLQKLEEAKRKRDEKKAAKKKAEYYAKWDNTIAEYSSIIETAEHYAPYNGFVASVLETVKNTGNISEKQESALISAFVKAQKVVTEKEHSSNEWIGDIKQRMEKELTCKAVFGPFNSKFGQFFIVNYKDADGNDYVYKGTGNPGLQKDETGVIKFTVKAHDIYKDKKQTVISRVANVN